MIVTLTRQRFTQRCLVAGLVLSILGAALFAVTTPPASAGYVKDGIGKGADETEGGVKKGTKETTGGVKKGVKEGTGGVKKGVKEGTGGVKKGWKETGKLFKKVF